MAKRRQKAEIQWRRETAVLTTTVGSPVASQLEVDPTDTLVYPIALVRLIGCVRLTMSNYTATASAGTVAFGLWSGHRSVPDLAKSIHSFAEANSGAWLFRHFYRLPLASVPTTGMIDLNNEPYRIDWQFPMGRAQLDKDKVISFTADCQMGGGSATVHFEGMSLWSVD